MQLSYEKLIAAVSMTGVTFISALLPILLVPKFGNEGSRPRNFRVVSFLSCFGGGVFMATCLLHLLPDVQEQMDLIFKSLNLNPNYPVAEFLMSIGFLIVMIVEQIILHCQGNATHEGIQILTHHHPHAEPHYQNYGSINENTEQATHDAAIYQDISHSTSPSGVLPRENIPQACSSRSISHAEPHFQYYGSINEKTEQATHDLAFNEVVSDTTLASSVQPHEDHEQHAHEVSFHQDRSSHSILRSLLLVFALSLHAIFEGLAIGLQSSVQNVIRILFAVLIHKCIIAFTLGLNLSHSKLERGGAIKGIIFFSLTSPIGIIIGLLVENFVTGMPMMVTSGILQGLATGTFLYVTFFEVLPHELNSNQDHMIKMGCLVLGFSVVSILLMYLPD